MKTLAIIGSGHLGQQIAHYAILDKHYDNVVFFDDFTDKIEVNGIRILGNTNIIENEYNRKSFDEILIGIGYKHLIKRKEFFNKYVNKIPFGKIIHSSCWIDKTAKVMEGCVVYPGCIIDANCIINRNTILNIGCAISHDTVVGNHCFLSPRVSLAGFINIEELCIIGINATVIDNINITCETQIGGGTVVIQHIETKGLYVGNPHKFVR